MQTNNTRGLRERKDLIVLIIIGATGLVFLFLALYLRQRLITPPGVVATALPPGEILRLRERARGPMPDLAYKPAEMARIASFSVAKRADGSWSGLAAGTILQVTTTTIENGETWVTGIVQQGSARNQQVTVHTTFLQRYLPVVLDQTLEFSDMRLTHVTEKPVPKMTVSGWLRNITSQTISQCVVSCEFYDNNGKRVDERRSTFLTLPPLELIRFETAHTEKEKEFTSISVQITHATPDGLRNYLSTIVVQRSSMQ